MARAKKGADGRKPRLTPSSARNMVGVVKILVPAVLPVLSPYLLKAAGTARDQLDRLKARRMGVDVTDLAKFSGRGGTLHARIAGAADGLTELADKHDDAATREFTTRARDTLASLAAVVRAAERMPTSRRKAAHQAVSTELDRVESELLRRFGV
ncbi:MAG TPA: DUF6474 family protein [Pseudonocardiaceae bacterium]|jgi:hypothetical protein|nr:DUF6474 family protein [Pseudonocardiaceae bacterium]